MFRTTLKNLSARKLRLFTTSFAVLLGVAFMAGTLVLTDTIGKTFDKLFADVNKGTDAYVRAEVAFDSEWFGDQRPRLDASLDRRRSTTSTASPRPRGTSRPTPSSSTRPASRSAIPTWVRRCSVPHGSSNDDLNPFDLTSGRAPAGRRRGGDRQGQRRCG